jgi:hypothetical protein
MKLIFQAAQKIQEVLTIRSGGFALSAALLCKDGQGRD